MFSAVRRRAAGSGFQDRARLTQINTTSRLACELIVWVDDRRLADGIAFR